MNTSAAAASSFGAQVMDSMEKSRVRYEMSWQIDECETEKDACEDFCTECVGNGRQVCRFCRGTKVMALENGFARV